MSNNPRLFWGKYRSESNRLKDWDYSTPGSYFITICTHNKVPWFGGIKNDHMVLSEIGVVVSEGIGKIEKLHRNTRLDAWVVMPNHIHVIIEIIKSSDSGEVETPHWGVSTNRYWRSGTIGVTINQFKSYCTKRIRSMRYTNFAWQSGYYDHIIRNEKSLKNIHLYILGNPAKWAEDEYFSKP